MLNELTVLSIGFLFVENAPSTSLPLTLTQTTHRRFEHRESRMILGEFLQKHIFFLGNFVKTFGATGAQTFRSARSPFFFLLKGGEGHKNWSSKRTPTPACSSRAIVKTFAASCGWACSIAKRASFSPPLTKSRVSADFTKSGTSQTNVDAR